VHWSKQKIVPPCNLGCCILGSDVVAHVENILWIVKADIGQHIKIYALTISDKLHTPSKCLYFGYFACILNISLID
jgi:hypothetical protein